MENPRAIRSIMLGVGVSFLAFLAFEVFVLPVFAPQLTANIADLKENYQAFSRLQLVENLFFAVLPGLVAGTLYGRRGLIIGAAAGLVAALITASFLMLFIDARLTTDVVVRYWQDWIPRILIVVVGSSIGGFIGAALKR